MKRNPCNMAAATLFCLGLRERALAAECGEFDTKPTEFDRLIQKIDLLLANSWPHNK